MVMRNDSAGARPLMKFLVPGCVIAALSVAASAQTTPSGGAANRSLSAQEVQNIFNAHQNLPRPSDPCLETLRKTDALRTKPLQRGALYDLYERECHGRERVPRMNEDPSSLRR
jgi:hypothetical protein